MNRNIISPLIKSKLLSRFCSYKPVRRPTDTKKSPKVSEISESPGTLSKQLRAKILATGPITVAEYMKEVLINPSGGYYMNRDVFGCNGDFITSPEINQIFGELVAIWCIAEWQKLGSPRPFQIIELGPGRGTLCRDILRVFSHFKLGTDFSIHLVEVSPFLSKIQAQNLCYQHSEIDKPVSENDFYRVGETLSGAKIFWYKKLAHVPGDFSIILAHEFFDALPVHKLQKVDGIWKEVLIDIEENDSEKFRFVLSKSQTPISKIYQPLRGDARECLELSLEGELLVDEMASRLEQDGGFALIMDYGHYGEKTDSFRAFKQHKLHDPLIEPGSADITADVDFKHLQMTAEKDGKLITFGPVEQGTFLKRMEGDTRLKILLENALPDNHERIKSGYRMLTDPDQMGKRYKFLSLFPSVLKHHHQRFPVTGFYDRG